MRAVASAPSGLFDLSDLPHRRAATTERGLPNIFCGTLQEIIVGHHPPFRAEYRAVVAELKTRPIHPTGLQREILGEHDIAKGIAPCNGGLVSVAPYGDLNGHDAPRLEQRQQRWSNPQLDMKFDAAVGESYVHGVRKMHRAHRRLFDAPARPVCQLKSLD